MDKYRLMAPGPVTVPEQVRLAMARSVIHHRAPEFLPILQEIRENLGRVFQTREPVLILASSGTGAMEAAVANLISPGDRAVVVPRREGNRPSDFHSTKRSHWPCPI